MNTSQCLSEFSKMVEVELRRLLSERDLPLYSMMEYHLGWGEVDSAALSTRPRALASVCLASCAALGANPSSVVPAAAAIELVWNFCEIHDDIQSGAVDREGRDSVWWKWGPAQAINAGDGMHALARLALFRLRDLGFSTGQVFDAVKLLDKASLATCEGRFVDLQAQERLDVTSESYLSMAASKTGSLYACAMEFGGLGTDADSDARAALASAGTHLGVAIQISEDVRLLAVGRGEGSTPSNDFMNKKKLYPVVKAFEIADPSQRRALGDFYFKRVLEPGDAQGLASLIAALGAVDSARSEIDAHLESAVTGVRQTLPDTEATSELVELMRHLASAD